MRAAWWIIAGVVAIFWYESQQQTTSAAPATVAASSNVVPLPPNDAVTPQLPVPMVNSPVPAPAPSYVLSEPPLGGLGGNVPTPPIIISHLPSAPDPMEPIVQPSKIQPVVAQSGSSGGGTPFASRAIQTATSTPESADMFLD